ncbi:uncharacterized protein [Drosophila tropicalis]|uniref:uncharacterized protein n=1 Tax=Drosophila tropicalis TaxID=46794 RepID=UPI0035ABB8BF
MQCQLNTRLPYIPHYLKTFFAIVCVRTMSVAATSWPPVELPNISDAAYQLLMESSTVVKPQIEVDLDIFKKVSQQFPIKFGIDTCRVKSQPASRHEVIREQIASAYPVIHERTLLLYLNFLEHKKKFGNSKELQIYKDLSLTDFVQRLLSKRCVYFFGGGDAYLLLDGQKGYGGFEQIGTEDEKPPLILQNVLSYDEIKLAALLYASTHSEFINNGSRSNAGIVQPDKSTIETEGVIIGMIGARFERDSVMDYEDILITPTQNMASHGYGSMENGTRATDYRLMWRNFYGEPRDFLNDQVKIDGKRFIELAGYEKFDTVVMHKRYAITFDTLLLEAQSRAKEADKPAYIHMVGYGLGVWKISEEQERIFFEAFEERLLALIERDLLSHIGAVHFSWFHLKKVGGLYDGAVIPQKSHNGIKILISVRNPADKLMENMLPVVTYAWDGNALPGNEFWANMLVSTGDPAAACSTLISELQNPHINLNYMSGTNLHIASLRHGLMHIGEFAQKVTQRGDN